MKKVYLLAFLFIASFIGYAQKTTLPLTSFNGVDAFGPFDIELIKSDTESVEINYNGIDQDDVVAELQRGYVKLKLKSRHYFDDWNNNHYKKSQYMKVKVYYKDMDNIKVQAGAVLTSKERLKSKYLSIISSMGAEVKLDILVKDLEVESNMGALTEVIGQAEQMNVKASMGGVLKATQLSSKVVNVKASMGAEVTVNALNELEASSSFGAVVQYIGGPAVRHTNKSMGGEVNGN